MDRESHSPGFLDLVIKTLNIEYAIALQHDFSIQAAPNPFIFDLADPRNQTFVEIMKNGKAIHRGENLKKIAVLTDSVLRQTSSRPTICIVFEESTDQKEIGFYKHTHASNPLVRYDFFDRRDILKLASDYKISVPPGEQWDVPQNEARQAAAGSAEGTNRPVKKAAAVKTPAASRKAKTKATPDVREEPAIVKGRTAHAYANPMDHNGPDRLDVGDDIKAFASLLAYKKATPPIAIGLFGNWGSGKSYFMTNVRKEIDKLHQTNDPDYCDRIVHVAFNSWHYTDADLWASLVTKIFKELDTYLKGSDPHKNIDSFYHRLGSVQKDLEAMKKKRVFMQTEKRNLEGQITGLQSTQQHILRQMQDDTAERKLLLSEPVRAVLREAELLTGMKAGDSIQTVNALYRQFDGFRMLLKNTWSLLRKHPFQIALILLIATAVIFGKPLIDQWIKDAASAVNAYLTSLGAAAASFAAIVVPKVRKVLSYAGYLQKLSANWDEKLKPFQQEAELFHTQRQLEMNQLKEQENRLTEEMHRKEMEVAKIDQEISDIKSGKKLAEFVAERNENQKYKNRLGVISWVREDFEELDKLLRFQKNGGKNSGIDDQHRVDRIILYIDDLDRCPEERVVQVLEAVHLLLSFELFGVVVGVDPRWISHSLHHRYKGLFRESFSGEPRSDTRSTLPHSGVATTYDYLEKIFQIPFALLPVEEKAAKNLLYSILTKTPDEDETGEKAGTTDTDTSQTGKQPEGHSSSGAEEPGSEAQKSAGSEKQSASTTKERNDESADKTQERSESSVTISSEELTITGDEIAFILELAGVIGNTPRTIQRFVNVYRIIRAHPKILLDRNFSDEHRRIICLLAIVVGKPRIAGQLMQRLNDPDNEGKQLIDILENLHGAETVISVLQKNKDYTDSTCLQIKEWSALVSRFSFRAVEMMSEGVSRAVPVENILNPDLSAN